MWQLQNHPQVLDEVMQVEGSGEGFFDLNTLRKLLLLASCRLLLASSLNYSLYFPTNFPFNLKLSQFENCMKFELNLTIHI